MKTFSSKERKHSPVRTPAGNRPAVSAPTPIRQIRVIRQILGRPTLQGKLTVSAPNDAHEKEADRVADAVVRTPDEALSRQPLEEEEELLQTMPGDGEAFCPDLQRQVEQEEEEEELLQPKRAGDEALEVTADLEPEISFLRGEGQPLSEKSRAFFEPRMGLDLSHVKVHTGALAADLARRINARAFTLGDDIYFGAGQFDPGSLEGKKLMAHELTHVVQQNGTEGACIARYPNTQDQNFWEELRQDVYSQWYQPVLSTDERALAQLIDDLRAQDESPSGNLALDAVDFGLDLAQAHPAAKFAIKLLKHVYDRLEATRSATIRLADFSLAQRLEHQTFERNFPGDWSEVNEDSEDLLQRLLALKNDENDENRIQQREAAVRMLISAHDQIPDFRLVERQLIRAWVAGAADQPLAEATVDLPDPAGFSTGYLRIYARIETDMYLNYLSHRFTAINIDDIDAPSGTKTAIRHAFGNTYLDELPFPGRIVLIMGSTGVIFEKRSREATEDLQGWTASTFGIQARFEESSIEARRQLYFQHIRPRVEHLQPDD